LAALIGMPESIKYMALHKSQRRNLQKLIADIRPDFARAANARFVVEDEKQYPGFNPIYLFRDGLAVITPLLWLLFALNLMGYFFLASWTPTLLAAAQLPPTTAALAGAMLQVGGTVGALTRCRWLGGRRFFAVTVLFVIAVPIVASIGYAGVTSRSAVIGAAFFAGFCVLGIQSGINVAGALIYPTSLRANGSGWELGIGRLGSIAGPLLGALFVGLPVQQLYLWSALPLCAWRHHLPCDSSPRCAATAGAPVAARAARARSEAVRQELIDPAWTYLRAEPSGFFYPADIPWPAQPTKAAT
jgi:MFS transporter, AAHS family, 4-hydroxybenzoate transporter